MGAAQAAKAASVDASLPRAGSAAAANSITAHSIAAPCIAADISGDDIQALQFPPSPAPCPAGGNDPTRHPIVIVGAGPVGLSLAIDLCQRGQRVLLLDNDDRLSTGSRAICFAKRTLEVWDRLGVGEAMVAKGVSWQVGRLFHGERQVFQFDLQPEPGHERPAFINLQQYYAEAYLLKRAFELPKLRIQWKHEVTAVQPLADGARLIVDTPSGRYHLEADHVIACDGSRSALRHSLGLESQGRTFRDRFLIADVRMQVARPAPGRSQAAESRPPESVGLRAVQVGEGRLGAAALSPLGGQRSGAAASVGATFPAERWFWFDPPFHRGYSTLLHRQPDGVWRIDWQLGWDADPQAEKQPAAIRRRVDAMMRQALGHEVAFELVWASVYTFSCQRMQRFAQGRVLFAGDAAHGVSPFGARGANSGVQDAENLAWKLDAVLRGEAPHTLLTSYADEREAAADENIQASTRATDFITPKSDISRLFRDAVLSLAAQHGFARRLVNSGRLSVPAVLEGSALNTADEGPGAAGQAPGAAHEAPGVAHEAPGAVSDSAAAPTRPFSAAMRPGTVAADAPVLLHGTPAWLLRQLQGPGFTLLHFGPAAVGLRGLDGLTLLEVGEGLQLHDPEGTVFARYDADLGSAYLIRPDQHIAARWRAPTPAKVAAALRRALGHAPDLATNPR